MESRLRVLASAARERFIARELEPDMCIAVLLLVVAYWITHSLGIVSEIVTKTRFVSTSDEP